MSWNDHHRRQSAIEAVLAHARENPAERPGPDTVPAARGVFGTSDELLCALQYKWTQLLTGRLDLAADGPRELHRDRVDAVREAWQATARAHPTLRAVLNEHLATPGTKSSRLRAAIAREQRMLARAGDPAESLDDASDLERTGSAMRGLVERPGSAAARPAVAGR